MLRKVSVSSSCEVAIGAKPHRIRNATRAAGQDVPRGGDTHEDLQKLLPSEELVRVRVQAMASGSGSGSCLGSGCFG